MTGRWPEVFENEAFEITAVESARYEVELRLFAGRGRVGLGRQPMGEMTGIVGERAHVRRADIEQVARVAGGVSQTPPEFGARLHDGDAEIRRPAAEQMSRHQCAARAAANDRDPPGWRFRHAIPEIG